MSDFLFFHPKAADVTGPMLGKTMDISYGSYCSGRYRTIIRYGTTKPGGVADRVLNTAASITLASDKLASLNVLLKNGVLAPAPSASPHSLPAIGRKRRHESGNGLWICLQASDVTNALNSGAQYFVPYIPTREEYRVHVLRGEALLMQRKVLRSRKTYLWQWIRNNANGWGFDQIEIIPNVAELGVRSVNALGLDFGAVDIILSDRGYLYVLEVNTAPALRKERLQIWSEGFRRILCAE